MVRPPLQSIWPLDGPKLIQFCEKISRHAPPNQGLTRFRAKQWESSSEVRERTVSVRLREQTFRAFAVNKSILSWKDQTTARFDEILAARDAATMQHAATIMPDQITGASELGEKLEQVVHMALNEVVAILGFSLDPDDRAFASILKAKTTILSSVLNAQVRVDERRFVKKDTEHDLEMEKLFSERMKKAQLEIDRLAAGAAQRCIAASSSD